MVRPLYFLKKYNVMYCWFYIKSEKPNVVSKNDGGGGPLAFCEEINKFRKNNNIDNKGNI